MKKIIFTLFIVILMTINASAQYKPFQFGLKIEPGIGWAKLDSENPYNNKAKMNFNWGFVGNFYFVENYGMSTGFNIKFINCIVAVYSAKSESECVANLAVINFFKPFSEIYFSKTFTTNNVVSIYFWQFVVS